MEALVGNKRSRVDLDELTQSDSAEWIVISEDVWRKRSRVGSDTSGNLEESDELTRVNSLNTVGVNLLDILDGCEVNDELDSFMKSFEEETSITSSPQVNDELGFLFEASDDELGLPPSVSVSPFNEAETRFQETESTRLPDSVELSELWRLDDQILNYDSFDFVLGYSDPSHIICDYVAIDGLFD